MKFKYIEGGVCAPRGFKAAGIHAGFKKDPDKRDLALIFSEERAACAGVYTTNKIKGAPIAVTREHIADGYASCIITNSGNANTCAPGGKRTAEETCRLLAGELGIAAEDVAVCSTGVIGEELDLGPFRSGMPALVKALDSDGSEDCCRAIMTTDTRTKSAAVSFTLDGRECRIGGIAKGSGMINPGMATMLAFVTSDAAVGPEILATAVREDVRDSFNQICVDGDMSTNDTFLVMANGMAGNRTIESADSEEYRTFTEALSLVTRTLARLMAGDGEGAGKTVICNVLGAKDDDAARRISKSVISSNLLKAAVFGADANWGRVICAIGYTDGDFSAANIDISMSSRKGSVQVCRGSMYAPHDEEKANGILDEKEITIDIDMNEGEGKASAWGCDLTYGYVKINGDYRS